MDRRQIIRNAFMSVLQIIAVGLILFFLYGFLLRLLGAEQLGLWSLVLSATSITQIAIFGFSGGILKYVAKYTAKGDQQKVLQIVQTATTSVAVLVGVLLILSYPLVRWLLRFVLPATSMSAAQRILPYAFIAFWLMAMSGVFQSGLDGYRRIDKRASLIIIGNIVHVAFCVLLTPRYRLMGLAYAKIMENMAVLIGGWIILRTHLRNLPILPLRWDKSTFREMSNYSLNFQAISLAGVLYEPVTKGLLSKYSNLSLVGYYEMASRLVQQVRLAIVSAGQVIVPEVASLQEHTPERIIPVYRTSSRFTSYISLPLFTALAVMAPCISVLWIGHHESSFVFFVMVLSLGWLVNTLSTPAYFVYLGVGDLRWNVIGHISIALLNGTVGYLMGRTAGGIGVIIAWVSSLSFGSILIALSFFWRNGLPVFDLVPEDNKKIMLSCSLVTGFSVLLYILIYPKIGIVRYSTIIAAIFVLLLFIPLWHNPMRTKIKEWIFKDLLANSEAH